MFANEILFFFLGYYEVNTKVVRETMKAVFPAICDRSTVGTYIARECKQMPIYTLEKVNNTGKCNLDRKPRA